jgi:hypothetical protein
MLSVVKRVDDYETLGALFRESQKNTLEMGLNERIWLFIKGLVQKIAEIFERDHDYLTEMIITDNQYIAKYINLQSVSISA